MGDPLDAAVLRRWCPKALQVLELHREELDDLNVYPVADGDTGTNLLLTWRAVAEAARTSSDADIRPAMIHAALVGARGNSGTILSQLLAGLLGAPPRLERDSARGLAAALSGAANAAYAAVAAPVEGTVLTVARAAAVAARTAAEGAPGRADLPADGGKLAVASLGARAAVLEVARAAAEAARAVLARTPQLLPPLAAAGVVDAAGQGLVLLLEALVEAVGGDPGRPAPLPPLVARPLPAFLPATRSAAVPSPVRFEVTYLLAAPECAVAPLRAALAACGDSVVVAGGQGVLTVHVHTHDIGGVVEVGLQLGRPHRLSVQQLPGHRGVLVEARGSGLVRLLQCEGAQVCGSRADLLAAVQGTCAAEVIVVPGTADTLVAAEAALPGWQARRPDQRVAVITAPTPVHVLAALACYDPVGAFTFRVRRLAEVVAAVRAADVSPGPAVVGRAIEVVARLLAAGGEQLTVLRGEAASGAELEEVARRARSRWPALHVCALDGGQPLQAFSVGVE